MFTRPWTSAICALAALACLLVGVTASAADVVVVRSKASSKAARLYNKAISGFRDAFGKPFDTLVMQGDLVDPGRLAEAVDAVKPKVIVAIGLKAAKILRAKFPDVPIVFCMVSLTIQQRLKADNTTGVAMQTTPGQQLKAFKEVVPGLKKVGVIYHPKLSGSFVASAKSAAKGMGLQLVERSITDKKEVIEALKGMLGTIDGLWLLRDGKVVTQEFFLLSLQVQAEKKIPLMVFSDQFVKKGALCSYSASYQSQGVQAARIAKSILSGTRPSDIPIQAPDGTLTINLTSASKVGVKVPAGVLKRPDVKTVGK